MACLFVLLNHHRQAVFSLSELTITLKDQNGILSKPLSLCCMWTSYAAEFACFIKVFRFTYVKVQHLISKSVLS